MGFPWGNPVSQVHKNEPPSPFQQDAFAPHGSLEQEFSSSVSSSAFPSSRDEFESVFSSSNSSFSVWLSFNVKDNHTENEELEEEKTDSNSSLEEGKAEDETEEENSCSSDPCGANASCWNGDGGSFLCTCDTGFPHGNPYNKCV